jgi:hypothetical protein
MDRRGARGGTGGLSFDGVDDVVTVVPSETLAVRSTVTVEAWVRPASDWISWSPLVTTPSVSLSLGSNGSSTGYDLWVDFGMVCSVPIGVDACGGDARRVGGALLREWGRSRGRW